MDKALVGTIGHPVHGILANMSDMHEASPLTIATEAPDRILLAVAGDLTDATLPALQAAIETAQVEIRQLSQRIGAKVRILLDLSGFSGTYSVPAMEAMTAFAHGNTEQVAKTAVFGGSEKGDMAAEAVAALADRENIKVFGTKEEALVWLDKDQ